MSQMSILPYISAITILGIPQLAKDKPNGQG